MAQAVEYLSGKCEALSSNPIPPHTYTHTHTHAQRWEPKQCFTMDNKCGQRGLLLQRLLRRKVQNGTKTNFLLVLKINRKHPEDPEWNCSCENNFVLHTEENVCKPSGTLSRGLAWTVFLVEHPKQQRPYRQRPQGNRVGKSNDMRQKQS
jgi:hypothetical protein